MLIGETDSDVCGHMKLTWDGWGLKTPNSHHGGDDDGGDDGASFDGGDGSCGDGAGSGSSISGGGSGSDVSVDNNKQGFRRTNLSANRGGEFGDSPTDALDVYQICRSDSSTFCGFSKCVSFRRVLSGADAAA